MEREKKKEEQFNGEREIKEEIMEREREGGGWMGGNLGRTFRKLVRNKTDSNTTKSRAITLIFHFPNRLASVRARDTMTRHTTTSVQLLNLL